MFRGISIYQSLRIIIISTATNLEPKEMLGFIAIVQEKSYFIEITWSLVENAAGTLWKSGFPTQGKMFQYIATHFQ